MKLKLLPICTQSPRTTSFRVRKDDMYKTINSVYFDDSVETTPDSWFTNSAESVSTTASSSSDSILDEPSDVEAVIRGAQQSSNQRLFFEPGESSALLVGHVTVAVESEDPRADFKKSMAEMLESLGVRQGDFEGLKELLGWYLKANEEGNHGYILAAYVDLISGFSVRRSNKNDHSNDKKNNDDDDEESLAASFTSAAAVSLSSVASTAVSARLLLGEDSDHT